MASFDYNLISEYLTVSYKCPECGEITTSDAMYVPKPNYYAEKARDSENSEDYEATCENCGSATPVYLYTRYDGGYGDMPDVKEIVDIEEEMSEEELDYYEAEFFEETKIEYSRIIDKLGGLNETESQTMYQLLFVNVIARMEAYLGDTLKREVLNDDASMRNFLEKYKDYKEIVIKLTDIYHCQETLRARISKDLCDLMYHNLPKIKEIYKSILGVNMGDISSLVVAVKKRHHIVHRNGKDLDGNPVTVTREEIERLWTHVSSLISTIETSLNEKNEKITDDLVDSKSDDNPFEIELPF